MRVFLVSVLLVVAVVAGCRSGLQGSAMPDYKIYKLRGKIVSTNAATGEATVNHAAIPGLMDAMTMPYKLKDPGALSRLHPGDTITADMLVPQKDDGALLLDHIVVVAQARPGVKPMNFSRRAWRQTLAVVS